jgi:hypothetical protein
MRSLLYKLARVLGDVNAVERAVETHSVRPIEQRMVRKVSC